METIKTIEKQKIVWTNLTNVGERELGFLASNFNFHELDLKDCLPPLQRPKLIDRNRYLFMILQFPVYNEKTKEIETSEMDFFISPDYIATVNEGARLEPLKEFFGQCQTNERIAKETFESAHVLLYTILEKLLIYCFPILNHVGWDIDAVEKKIFDNFDKETVREILNIKRNIVNFRRAMQAHKNVLKKLTEKSGKFETPKSFEPYFSELIEQTKEVWDLLENYQGAINALYETHESLANFRLNNIIKTLTIFSVIILPLTLIASIFGMNVEAGMPLLRHTNGFWMVMALMAMILVGMYFYFKKKRWI